MYECFTLLIDTMLQYESEVYRVSIAALRDRSNAVTWSGTQPLTRCSFSSSLSVSRLPLMGAQRASAARVSARVQGQAHRRVSQQLPLFLSGMSWDDLSLCVWTELPATKKRLSYPRILDKFQSLVRWEGHQFCVAFLECFERG
jgi:hypothetical protein